MSDPAIVAIGFAGLAFVFAVFMLAAIRAAAVADEADEHAWNERADRQRIPIDLPDFAPVHDVGDARA